METIGHISHVGDGRLPDEAMSELGVLLKKASLAIQKSDSTIERILVASLNTGRTSKHMHVHLIPRRTTEQVKTPNNPKDDGGGFCFLARKEIVVDTLKDFLESTTGDKSIKLKNGLADATKAKIQKNAKTLRMNFEHIWQSDNKLLKRYKEKRSRGHSAQRNN